MQRLQQVFERLVVEMCVDDFGQGYVLLFAVIDGGVCQAFHLVVGLQVHALHDVQPYMRPDGIKRCLERHFFRDDAS